MAQKNGLSFFNNWNAKVCALQILIVTGKEKVVAEYGK
jgi:hypothetical protein